MHACPANTSRAKPLVCWDDRGDYVATDGRRSLETAQQPSRPGGATPRREYGNFTRPIEDDDRFAMFCPTHVMTDAVAKLTDLHFGHADMIAKYFSQVDRRFTEVSQRSE
jgi:hypothetical protein